MTLYIDIHRNVTAASPEEVRRNHISDLEAQESYGVKYLKYWYDPSARTICCLIDAPSKEACSAVHRDAHGDLADEIIEVESGLLESFLSGPADDLGCALNHDGSLDGAFRTVLFTDLVGSTAMTQARGDAGAMKLLRTHDEIVRTALDGHGGREVKHTGDGIMAAFVEVSSAVMAAKAITTAVDAHNAEHQEDRFEVCIGMSAGEPVAENQDLFGAAVQLAARVCAEAGPGEILVAQVVRDLCIGKPLTFEDRGTFELKGFPEPVQIHVVR